MNQPALAAAACRFTRGFIITSYELIIEGTTQGTRYGTYKIRREQLGVAGNEGWAKATGGVH